MQTEEAPSQPNEEKHLSPFDFTLLKKLDYVYNY